MKEYIYLLEYYFLDGIKKIYRTQLYSSKKLAKRGKKLLAVVGILSKIEKITYASVLFYTEFIDTGRNIHSRL